MNFTRGTSNLLTTKTPDYSLRVLGVLPLVFFVAQGIHYWHINELGNMLWMCNIGNLLLAIGLFLENRFLMRVAIIWTIPGLIIWFLYVVLTWGVFFTSTLAHVGGLLVGLVALKRIGMEKNTWRYASGWFLLLQVLSRVFTSASLNVNLAHKIQPGWDRAFGAYWQFWAVLMVVMVAVLFGVELLFRKLWPVRMATG